MESATFGYWLAGMPDELARAYDSADSEFLRAIRDGEPRDELQRRAAAAAEAARAWQAAAYPHFFAIRDEHGGDSRLAIEAEIEAEKAEVLSELWIDLAAALGAP